MRGRSRTSGALVLLFVCACAQAQLTLRQTAEVEDPGTSSKPARIGYAHNDEASSASLGLALNYQLKSRLVEPSVKIDPFVTLEIQDDDTIGQDRKAVEAGAALTIGNRFERKSIFLVDVALGKERDRGAGTEGDYLRLTAILVSDYLVLGDKVGYVPGKWALFIRPRIGGYYTNTDETDDPLLAPTGSVRGVLGQVTVNYFPLFSSRTRITYLGKISHDTGASGNRVKGTYRKHVLTAEYLFYDFSHPPAPGSARFSLIGERRIGADPLEGQPRNKQRTAIYLGVKF